jgi:hypothetical protein
VPLPAAAVVKCVAVAVAILLNVGPSVPCERGVTHPPPPVTSAKKAPAVPRNIFPANRQPHVVGHAPRSLELGLRFGSSRRGRILGLRFYRAGSDRAAHSARVWSPTGKLLATAAFPARATPGWQATRLRGAVNIGAGRRYVVSYSVAAGQPYAVRKHEFLRGTLARGDLTAYAGVRASAGTFPDNLGPRSNYLVDVNYRRGTGVPSEFPNEANTGVPPGLSLSRYKGPCTITRPSTITGVDASGCDAILIHAAGVVINKSLLPRVDASAGGAYSVRINQSTIEGGDFSDGALWGYNITARRVDVTGGQHSVHCNDNCTIVDSWLHDQYNPASESYHNNAFITNGGSHMVVRHNTLHCTAILNSNDGGCTADVSLFGDFDAVTDVLIENNLFKANNSSISYCAYGGYQPSKSYPVATGIRYLNNVFERGANNQCGVYGAVTSFQHSAKGNQWSGNKWSDGRTVRSR